MNHEMNVCLLHEPAEGVLYDADMSARLDLELIAAGLLCFGQKERRRREDVSEANGATDDWRDRDEHPF